MSAERIAKMSVDALMKKMLGRDPMLRKTQTSALNASTTTSEDGNSVDQSAVDATITSDSAITTDTPSTIADTNRNIMRGIIRDAFLHYDEWTELSQEYREHVVRVIERSCLKSAYDECIAASIDCRWGNPRFLSRYSINVSNIAEHINPTSQIGTKYVGLNIINDIFDIYRLCEKKTHELYPEYARDIIDEYNLRTQQKVEMRYSDVTCSRCGKNKVIFTQSQRRAADELPGYVFQCMEETCGKVWGT